MFHSQILRTEYIGRLETVRGEIERKCDHLRALKASQAASVAALDREKAALRDKAADLSERYEDLNDGGSDLQRRLESVLRRVQARCPVSSDAEMRMVRQLKEISRRSKDLANAMEQIRIKEKYQMRQIEEYRLSRYSSFICWVFIRILHLLYSVQP